ncbi:metal ABC transporter permease [Desulfovibrio litoralis]|uniref:Zinc transport system permease protein n=1 Tax=Desulfovibrio litoralis DSM 11393 TaxID=1121455 RepID=A0A1M7TIP1_9BACT|nr:metal ABC transporter permease [Desulfovibrio litoralis]SHN70468.1 zinc transport system permease protein [Desulfovibrio litoralis DSM 11393]
MLIEFFQNLATYSFLQNACLAAILAGIACGLLGPLVLINRLSFLTGAVSHVAYGGIGLAFFLNLAVFPVTMIFTLVSALLMGFLSLGKKNEPRSLTETRSDTAIGIFWAAGMALGIILIDLSGSISGDFMGFLFGSIITVSTSELFTMSILILIIFLLILVFHQGLWAVSLDKDFARTKGLPVDGLYLLLIALAAVTVVMLIRLTGLILVMALMTIPSRLALTISHSLWLSMFLSAIFAVCFAIIGLILSYMLNLSPGAAVVGVASLSALLFFGVKKYFFAN